MRRPWARSQCLSRKKYRGAKKKLARLLRLAYGATVPTKNHYLHIPIPPKLHAAIKRAARADDRSVRAYVVRLLMTMHPQANPTTTQKTTHD